MINRMLFHALKATKRSVFLLAVNIIIIAFFAIIIFVQNVTDSYYRIFVEEEGYSFFVGTYSGGKSLKISPQFINEVQQLEHVVGYNMSAAVECQPINFINVPYASDQNLSSEKDDGRIRLVGNYDTYFYETFRKDEMVVEQGDFPDKEHPGALIDKSLAEENNLSVGDVIEFEGNFHIEVIGIYRTLNVPKIKYDTYYATASKSYIFCDLVTFCSIFDSDDLYTHIDVYIDNYANMSDVENKLFSICESWTNEIIKYYAVDNIENRISIDSGYSAVIGLSSLIPKVLIASISLALIILFLMTLLWIREHLEAFGIYRVLGKSTYEVAVILYFEILFIALLSTLFAGSIALLSLKIYSTDIVNLATTVTSSSFGDLLQEKEAIKDSINFKIIMKTSFIILAIETVAYILSVLTVSQLNWRTLLSESK